MRTVLVLGIAALLAACGADGDPVRPKPRSDSAISVSVTGTAEVGIAHR